MRDGVNRRRCGTGPAMVLGMNTLMSTRRCRSTTIPACEDAAVCGGARPPDGGVDAPLDRYRRPRAGRRDGTHRRRQRFDESRGIKFETFAERRVRGAMIDALRREAWPRGVRRVRRELEAAREELRRTMGCEPSVADLAAKVDRTRSASTAPSSASTRSNRPRRTRPPRTSTKRTCDGAHPVRAGVARQGLRARRARRSRARGHRLAALAGAKGRQPLLLR